MKVTNRGGLNVFLAKYFHFDWCVGEIEGKIVQEVRQVGRSPVHHRQGIDRRTFGLFSKGQVQELLGEALHLSRTEASQLVSVGMQNSPPSVGLPLLVHEAPIPGTCLEAGASYVVVLMGVEGGMAQFESTEVGRAAVDSVTVKMAAAFLLYGGRQRRIGTNGYFEVGSKPYAHSLDCFGVHVSDLLNNIIILAMPFLLLLLLLQEILLQR